MTCQFATFCCNISVFQTTLDYRYYWKVDANQCYNHAFVFAAGKSTGELEN